MNTKMLCRAVLLCILAMLFCAAVVWAQIPETVPPETCLGVPFLSEAEIPGLGAYRYHDYSEDLRFQNEHAAVDKVHSVIYISQKIDETTSAGDLTGTISSSLPGVDLFFLRDSRWEDLDNAVREGDAFRLLISDRKNTYMAYDVIFTTLPVIYIYGQPAYINEDTRIVSYGRIVVADPEQMGPADTGVESTYLHWRIRGLTSSREDKKPWKLAMKNKEGNNNDVDLLGLGADDDWILNPMNMEDTNVREMLFAQLWNEAAAAAEYNYPMSRGEYAEVLINGEYCGLYLLQRRVDNKYLSLNENQVVVKAAMEDGGLTCEFYPSWGRTVSQEVLDAFFLQTDCRMVNKANFVDVSLFLQLFVARDNGAYKNMFYVFDTAENSGSITMVPWDTDMTMGIKWQGDGFAYDYADAVTIMNHRMELPAMQQLYPDLDRDLCARWWELRQELFTAAHIAELVQQAMQLLENSGAADRDLKTWGLYHGGEDTVEKLQMFLEDRIRFLDTYYAQ